MITKTITLAGAELSSFLAAGGQTVNPNAAAAAATTPTVAQVPFPTAVATPAAATTSAAAGRPVLGQPSVAAAGVPTTSSPAAVAIPVPTSSSTTSTLATTSSTAAATIATSSKAKVSTTAATSTTRSVASAARAASSAARSGANVALSAKQSSAASGSSGLSGGGIAGLVIGLLIVFGIIAGFLLLWRKRKSDKAARESRSNSRNEKGMVKLEEEEVTSPGENKGFDFGNLPTIAPVSAFNSNARDGNFRSASPADMQRGAAVLGIQRPFTPPPGHPAHPAYQQPPALAANRQMQRPQGHPNTGPHQMGPQMHRPVGMLPSQMQQGRNLTPNGSQMPRKPIPATIASVPQRRLSSNNPFNDPANETRDVAPPLPKSTSPIVKVVGTPAAPMSPVEPAAPMEAAAPVIAPAPERRASVNSFVAGDDSLDGEDLIEAASPKAADTAVVPVSAAESVLPAQEDRPLSPNSEEPGPNRSKSVIVATDQWAARKAHLKNTLALSPKVGSPSTEQSPFADPMPLLDSQIGSFSPMNLDFDQHLAKDE